MSLTKQNAREVIDVYIRAWETQDEDLILTIFTEGATYHERVMREPIPDRDSIGAYWRSKVVEAQASITCRLLNLYLDGDTAIAEWEAEFDDLAQGIRKRMREIAVLEFVPVQANTLLGFEWRIASLREYWASETLGPAAATREAEAFRVRDERQFDLVKLADRAGTSTRRASQVLRRGGELGDVAPPAP